MDDLAWPTFEMFFHAVNNEWQQMGLPEGSTISSEVWLCAYATKSNAEATTDIIL